MVIASRSIVHKFLKRSSAWTMPERVLIGFLYVQLRSVKDFILHGNLKKANKSSLKTVDHHREGIYTSFKLGQSEFTEVIQLIKSNFQFQLIRRVRVRIPLKQIFVTLFFFFFFKSLCYSLFYLCGAYSQQHIVVN